MHQKIYISSRFRRLFKKVFALLILMGVGTAFVFARQMVERTHSLLSILAEPKTEDADLSFLEESLESHVSDLLSSQDFDTSSDYALSPIKEAMPLGVKDNPKGEFMVRHTVRDFSNHSVRRKKPLEMKEIQHPVLLQNANNKETHIEIVDEFSAAD